VAHLRGYKDLTESTNLGARSVLCRGHNELGTGFHHCLLALMRRCVGAVAAGHFTTRLSSRSLVHLEPLDQEPFEQRAFGMYASGEYSSTGGGSWRPLRFGGPGGVG